MSETTEFQNRKFRLAAPARSSAAVAYVSAFISWLILSFGLTAALKSTSPYSALAISSGDAGAQLTGERQREPELKPGEIVAPAGREDAARIRDKALAALRAEPLNAEAFRQLGRLAQQAKDEGSAAADFSESFRRFWRQPDVAVRLLQVSVNKQDFGAIMLYADALLRMRPDLLESILPVLLAVSDQPAARPALISTIRSRPPWRSAFLYQLGRSARSETAYMQIYQALKHTDAALSPLENRSFMDSLVARDQIDLALSLWLATLPAGTLENMPLLYNGRFELPVNDAPFNWALSQPTGASVQVSQLPGEGGRQALNVEFSGQQVVFEAVEQRLALTPGRYIFSGRFMSQGFRNARGMVWRIYCSSTPGVVAAETPRLLNSNGSWAPFEASLTVPPAKCASQILRLELAARTPSERIASGGLWFDDLAIRETP